MIQTPISFIYDRHAYPSRYSYNILQMPTLYDFYEDETYSTEAGFFYIYWACKRIFKKFVVNFALLEI